MTITLCIPTIKSFDTLLECVKSAQQGELKPDQIFIIDNSCGKLKTYLEQRHIELDNSVFIAIPEQNLGVAASFNTFLDLFEDYIICSNDDVVFKSDTIKLLVEAAESDPDGLFFFPALIEGEGGIGPCGNAWSCFLQRKKSLDIIGGYDEHYIRGYGEDNDYSRLLMLAGYKHIPVEHCSYYHYGSSTLKQLTPQERRIHDLAFEHNMQYHVFKWGATPMDGEKYTTPFDGQDPTNIYTYLAEMYGYA